MSAEEKRVSLGRGEVLVYKGVDIDRDVLDAIVDTKKRLLWAFVRGEGGVVRAVAYSEEHCIWLEESDMPREEEIEV